MDSNRPVGPLGLSELAKNENWQRHPAIDDAAARAGFRSGRR